MTRDKKDFNVRLTFLIVTVIFGVIAVYSFTQHLAAEETQQTEQTVSKEKSLFLFYPPQVPDSLTFCGEPVPLDDVKTRDAVDAALMQVAMWHSLALKYIKRSHRWFPLIDSILTANEVPSDFKYLAVAGSGFGLYTTYREAGFWRMPTGTARAYGLIVNRNVDERYNVEKATDVFCRYIKYAYKQTGSWTLAAAAYVTDINTLLSMKKIQRQESFYELYFSEAQDKMIFKSIAVKELLENPEKYGYYLDDDQKFPPFETEEIKVKSIPNLITFAKQQGVTYRNLLYYNPWLRRTTLPAAGRTFTIKLPADK